MELKPIYLIISEDPLLRQEACDKIRHLAVANGFIERLHFQVNKNFSWPDFLAAAHSQFLFHEKTLLEVTLIDNKLGSIGSQALQTYCQEIPGDKCLILVTNKIDGATKQTKWYKTMSSLGEVMQIWPPSSAQLPSWVLQRMRQASLEATINSAKLIAEFSEGNLLAAAQEVTKLQLLYGSGKITEQQVAEAIVDNAKYNIFAYADAVLAGDKPKAIRILENLRQEKTEPILIIWVLAKTLRELAAIHRLKERKKISLDAAIQLSYVKDSRKTLIKQALQNNSPLVIKKQLQSCAKLDRSCKGLDLSDIWQDLARGFPLYTPGQPKQ